MVVQGGTLGCRVLGAELGSRNFISKAVWKMENLQQVNDVIILCFRKNSVATRWARRQGGQGRGQKVRFEAGAGIPRALGVGVRMGQIWRDSPYFLGHLLG